MATPFALQSTAIRFGSAPASHGTSGALLPAAAERGIRSRVSLEADLAERRTEVVQTKMRWIPHESGKTQGTASGPIEQHFRRATTDISPFPKVARLECSQSW